MAREKQKAPEPVEEFEYDYHKDNEARQPRPKNRNCPPIIRSAYSKPVAVVFNNRGPDATEQHHTDSCNIHTILARFSETRTVDHVNRNQGSYGYATSEDLLGAHMLLEKAKNQYETLPAIVRDKFADVGEFIDFMNGVDGNISPNEIADQLLAGTEDGTPPEVHQTDDGATEEDRPIDPT